MTREMVLQKTFEDVERYIQMTLAEEERCVRYLLCSPVSEGASAEDTGFVLDESFRDMLLRKIDECGMTDADCYNKAQINRAHFNKIKNDASYNVQKRTVMAFIMALGLDIDEAEEMLEKAGYALSKSNTFDVILRYFIERRNYDILLINEMLYKYDQPLLGAGIRG